MLLLDDPSLARLALLGAVLCIANLALLSPAWLVVGRIFPGRNVFFARWGFLHLVRVVIVGVAIGMAYAYFVPAGWSGASALIEGMIGLTLALGGTCFMCAMIASRVEPDGVRTLGLQQERQGPAIVSGIFLYAATLPGVLGLAFLSPWVMSVAGSEWKIQESLPRFLELQGAEMWGAVFLMVILLPLFEETLFRGFIQPLLVQNLREVFGVGATSFIFALLHDESMFLPIFGLSLVLGAIKLRTQRLAAVWIVHALHNGLVLTLYTRVPELRDLL